MRASGAALGQAVGAQLQETIVQQAPSPQQAARIARAWSMVHGFAVLLLDGIACAEILAHLPPGESEATLLEAIINPGAEC